MTDYRTAGSQSETELVISRSRFIGRCVPISQEQHALEALDRIRRGDWDASHHCFAYRVGATASVARYSDDGEPSGTAGMPIMHVLTERGVTNVLVVVTRYFGGILLGAGGLVRAYSRSASDALDSAGIVDMRSCTSFRMQVPYPLWQALRIFLEEHAVLTDVRYTDTVTCSVRVRDDRCDTFLTLLSEKTDGRVSAEPCGNGCYPCPS